MPARIYDPAGNVITANVTVERLVGELLYGEPPFLAADVLHTLRGSVPMTEEMTWWRQRCRLVARSLPSSYLADAAVLMATLAAELESRRTEVGK